ncbi:hypothetical protein G6F40_016428 [Rhizopus arrhizus]|nr:hypothetical protein G6F40_016428 [Rhizopus arrhizus]
MANHDAGQFEVHVYAHLEVEDEVTERFKDYAHGWTRTNGMSDDVLARRIRADKIDILVDLAGHTANNRLGHRPYPDRFRHGAAELGAFVRRSAVAAGRQQFRVSAEGRNG